MLQFADVVKLDVLARHRTRLPTFLLSSIDAFFDMTLPEIINTMPHSKDVVAGLIAGQGYRLAGTAAT